MPQIEVRPYDAGDRAALVAGFALSNSGAPGGGAWGDPPSVADVWLTPYLDLEPESAFVVTADGRPCGYLVGCVDDAAFPSERQRILEAIRRHRLDLSPPAEVDEPKDERWPSHLHIDVEPVARGTGAARGLMELWFARLRAAGSPGCYLQTTAENTRAVRFFESVGFRPYGDVPAIPGSLHEGVPLHQLTMVRSV